MASYGTPSASAHAVIPLLDPGAGIPLSYTDALSRAELTTERAKFFETGHVEGPSGCPSISGSADFLARMKNDLSNDDVGDFLDLARQVSAANGNKLTPSGDDTYLDLKAATGLPFLTTDPRRTNVFLPAVEIRIGWTVDATETLQRSFAYLVFPSTDYDIDAAEAISSADHITLGLCVARHPETNPTGLVGITSSRMRQQRAKHRLAAGTPCLSR